jgi:parvulin-like peptidyl-prolyl isomerase
MTTSEIRTLSASGILLALAATLAIAQESPYSTAPPDFGAPPVYAITDTAANPEYTPPTQAHIFTPAETVAVVGDQHILAGDLLGQINQMLAPYAGKAPEEQIEEQRQKLMRQMLPGMVENKILYLEFLRQIPPERLKDVEKKLAEEFDQEKLDTAVERAKVNPPAEPDELRRKYGSSLEKERRAYMEQKLGRAMLGKEIDFQVEITHEEMLRYYHEHSAEFAVPARAKWEQLSVRFDNHPSKEDAWQKIAAMGNEVLRGAPLAAVAKRHSEAPNAAEGGQHDWITQGSLASTKIDEAVFTLPRNRLSQIIEDERGFHIVRILDREDAHQIDFVEAQADIKEKLKKQKVQEQVMAFVDRLKSRTRVWTVFDDEAQGQSKQTANNKQTRPR